jgi:hypothetical protein
MVVILSESEGSDTVSQHKFVHSHKLVQIWCSLRRTYRYFFITNVRKNRVRAREL